MGNKTLPTILLILVAVLIYYEFSFVTQAGQGLNTVQNDGYGGTGGVMLFLGGLIIGLLIERKK